MCSTPRDVVAVPASAVPDRSTIRLQCPPDALGRIRRIEVLDAVRTECVEHGIRDGGRGADRTTFAGALDAEWIRRRGRVFMILDCDRRQVGRARQPVIQERTAEQLTGFGFVYDLLE